MKHLVQMALDLFDPPTPVPVAAPDPRPPLSLSDAIIQADVRVTYRQKGI